MPCPAPLPSSANYFYSNSEGFTPPICGQSVDVTFCGTHKNLTPGMTISLISGPGATERYTYLVESVGNATNGEFTAKLRNIGGAPNGAPMVTGDLRWQVGTARDWRDGCDSLIDRNHASHFAVVSPSDPTDCCNPGCGCAGKLPIRAGIPYFTPHPTIPNAFIINYSEDTGGQIVINQNTVYNGQLTVNGDTTINGNLCVAPAPVDTTATPVGVTAAGCLRRIRVQRFVPVRRFIQRFNNTANGTLTLPAIPAGATHAVIHATLFINMGTNTSNSGGFSLQVEPNDATPYTIDSIAGIVSNQGDGDHHEGGHANAVVPVIATVPHLKWRCNFSNVPPATVYSSPVNVDEYSVTFFLDGYYVEQ